MSAPSDTPAPGLTAAGCRARQQTLRRGLEDLGLAAALVRDRRHVHYLGGYWTRDGLASALLVARDGPTVLVVPFPPAEQPACDVLLVYESSRLGTLIDDHPGAAWELLRPHLPEAGPLGCDGSAPVGLRPDGCVDILPLLLRLRRHKLDDEVALLRHTIRATEAAYAHARAALREGATEVELFAGMQAAAASFAGEVLGEFGNDFQIGAVGSPPRRRPGRAGEVAIFDLSVVLRGYRSDMCRSLVVGGRPDDAQLAARRRILEVLALVEASVRPGVSCRRVFAEAHALLQGYRGWSFPHHLGHGIGLSPHEAPRLNPHWDDAFEAGDVFTAEPGLYGPDLRAGLRIEEIYHLAPGGLVRLTSFPTELA